MKLGIFTKQPVEVIDYDINYEDWLTAGDSVESVVVAAPDGITIESTNINSPRVKIWVSGGTNSVSYKVTVTITTSDGRVKQDEFHIKVKDF